MLARRIIIYGAILLNIFGCKQENRSDKAFRTQITEAGKQDTLFRQLLNLTDNTAGTNDGDDSLAFLILPVEAACPSCRKKTIDSIAKYKDKLDNNHFVIITGTSRRIIESFFVDQGHELPLTSPNIFVDSTNVAFMNDIIFTRPEIYYAYNRKVYLKVSCVPVNIRKELDKFFSPIALAQGKNPLVNATEQKN